MKMSCGAYFNGVGFRIRGAYLYKVTAIDNQVLDRIQLSTRMIEQLEQIKQKYGLTNIERTQKVLELFKNGANKHADNKTKII